MRIGDKLGRLQTCILSYLKSSQVIIVVTAIARYDARGLPSVGAAARVTILVRGKAFSPKRNANCVSPDADFGAEVGL